MDEADMSDARIQHAIDDGIARARRELDTQHLTACGVCLWCEAPVGAGRIFCSPECTDDWRHDKDRRKDMGI